MMPTCADIVTLLCSVMRVGGYNCVLQGTKPGDNHIAY